MFKGQQGSNMISTILNNILIVVLTSISLFVSRFPEPFIITAGILMVIITYGSLSEENNRALSAAEFVLMLFFAVLSGSPAGFLVFIIFRTSGYASIITGLSLFVFTELFIYKSTETAMCIVRTLILTAFFLLLLLIYQLIEYIKKTRVQESKKLISANISEMHEKRLNEQLVMQNYLVQKNARLVERENISRNIHNSVGHSITAAIMTLDAADMLYDARPGEARRKMNDANGRIRGSLEAIRRAVRIMDEESTEIIAADLKCEMENIIDEFIRDTSICADISFSGLKDEIKIPHDHAIFLTGALQEMLTNGVKHGNADDFAVILLGDSAHIRLEVSDNGHSDFGDVNSEERIERGFGIKKMIKYAETCGGKTEFSNDNGFRGMVELNISYEV